MHDVVTRTWLVWGGALVLGLATAAMANDAVPHADAAVGRVYANAVCAQCHAIEAGARSSPKVNAPPFAALATSAKLTPSAIEGWLTSSHASMPDFAVPADRRADLIAYIKSLALKP